MLYVTCFYEYLYSDTSSGETDFVIGAREDPRARAGSSCDGQSEPAAQCVYNIKEWRNLSCNGCRAGNISDFCHFHKKEKIYAKNYTHRSIDNICTHTEVWMSVKIFNIWLSIKDFTQVLYSIYLASYFPGIVSGGEREEWKGSL